MSAGSVLSMLLGRAFLGSKKGVTISPATPCYESVAVPVPPKGVPQGTLYIREWDGGTPLHERQEVMRGGPSGIRPRVFAVKEPDDDATVRAPARRNSQARRERHGEDRRFGGGKRREGRCKVRLNLPGVIIFERTGTQAAGLLAS